MSGIGSGGSGSLGADVSKGSVFGEDECLCVSMLMARAYGGTSIRGGDVSG